MMLMDSIDEKDGNNIRIDTESADAFMTSAAVANNVTQNNNKI